MEEKCELSAYQPLGSPRVRTDSESDNCQTHMLDPDKAKSTGSRFALGSALAGLTAALGWIALALEGRRSIEGSLGEGLGLPEALFLYLRFFTILTNIGIALLMSFSAVRLSGGRPLPSARLFNAGLIYILVTCATYEIMLRSHWSPRGLQFLTDMVIHDIVPALTLLFWVGFAPRAGTRWPDALWMLVYPAAYFAMTLGAGALGEGYPYSFLNVDKLGLGSVLVVAIVFLATFYALGLVTTGLSKAWAREKQD